MKAFFLIVAILFFIYEASAQSIAQHKTFKKTSELKRAGVDTLFTYTAHYPIITRADTSACFVSNEWYYVVWLSNGHNYLQFFDECYTYNILKDQLPELQKVLTLGLKTIMTENIMPPTIKTFVNGKETLSELTISDDISYGYTFYLKDNISIKNFGSASIRVVDHFDHKNIYYKQNLQTTFKKLHDVLQTTWPELKLTKL
jgi:hypothetical protein